MKSSSFQTNAARLMFAALSTAGVFAVANLTGCTDPPPPPPPPVVYEAPAAAPAGPGKRAPGAPINAPRAPGFGNK